MFRKPKRNYRGNRRRDCDSDDETNDTVESYDVDKEEFVTVKLNKKKNEDDSAIQIIEVDPKPSKDASDIKEKKKKSKKNIPERKTVLSFEDEEEETETFKIKRSGHSRRVAKQLKRESKKEQEEKEKAKKLQKEEEKLKTEREAYEKAVKDINQMALTDEEESEDEQKQLPSVLSTGVIPDSRMIHEARKKRQMAREQGDYIPLEKEEKPTDKSRLIRDEDDEFDDERVNFSMKSRENEREEIRDKILRAEHGSDSESEHGETWEEQQIRKAVSIPQTNGVPQNESYSNLQEYIMTQSASIFNPQGGSMFTDENQSLVANQAPLTQNMGSYSAGSAPEQLPTLAIEQLKVKMQKRLDSITSVHRTHKLELDDINSRLESSKAAVEELQLNGPKIENQYKFYQEMKAYVQDLVECLNEKVPQIDLQERMYMGLMKTKAERLVKRRQMDIKDQSTQFRASRIMTSDRIDTAGMDMEMQRRAAEREARRSRRRRARESRSIHGHQEGTSTDEEDNTSDLRRFTVQLEQIQNDCDTMMEDVVDEFSEISDIRDRFVEWRNDYGDSYQEAYITLCLPKLFNPLIRLALVTWNPLEEDCADFENMVWFDSLILFGVNDEESLNNTNLDLKLLPSIVEKIVLVKITEYVTNVWDPMSTQQTSRLVNLIRKVVKDYPTVNDSSKNTQLLLKAVVIRLQTCLDDDIYIPLLSKEIIFGKSLASSFFQRQLWSSIKLLGNIMTWDGILSSSTVRSLGIDSLLNRYIMLALHNSPINSDTMLKLQVITSTFPREWFIKTEKEGATLPQLEHMCRYLTHIAGQADKIYRDGLPQICKFLIKLKAEDNARLVITKFNVNI